MIFAIDGASRRNGKPDCLSVGSVFCIYPDGTFGKLVTYEKGSTNQRGELTALVNALYDGLYCCRNGITEEIMLITDSEYIYNCLTKEWYVNWQIKGWVTAEGNPVKNKDLWVKATALLEHLHDGDFEVSVFHIKGHLVSVGKATVRKTIEADPSLKSLYDLVQQKYDEAEVKYADKFAYARELFKTNHGYDAPIETFREMIVCNTIADLYAGYIADKVDSGSVV